MKLNAKKDKEIEIINTVDLDKQRHFTYFRKTKFF